jgi:hypothetical protein
LHPCPYIVDTAKDAVTIDPSTGSAAGMVQLVGGTVR